MNQYILHYFNNRMLWQIEHFFRMRVEYILGGELSDRKK